MSEPAGRALRIVAYTDSPGRGGAEQTLGTLLAYLDPRHQVTVVGIEREVVEWIASRRPGSATVLVPHVQNKTDIAGVFAHLRVIRSLRPDILHVNLSAPCEGRYGQLAGLVHPGTRTVVVENAPVLPGDARLLRTKRLLSSRLDAHVAVGRWLADEVVEMASLPPGSIEVIHNGIPADGALESTSTPAVRPFDGFVVGSVGRLHREKGFDVLLRAAVGIDGLSVVLVGDGPDRSRLEDLVSEVGLSDRVFFAGWEDTPRRWLPTFDVFVLPSLLEGFPLSSLEAMAAGLPVIASDVGGVSEAVIHNETGVLVPPNDVDALAAALRSLAHDEHRRRGLGDAGRAMVSETFSARVMAEKYEALYRRVTGQA